MDRTTPVSCQNLAASTDYSVAVLPVWLSSWAWMRRNASVNRANECLKVFLEHDLSHPNTDRTAFGVFVNTRAAVWLDNNNRKLLGYTGGLCDAIRGRLSVKNSQCVFLSFPVFVFALLGINKPFSVVLLLCLPLNIRIYFRILKLTFDVISQKKRGKCR